MKAKFSLKPDIHLALLICIIAALILSGYVAYQYRTLARDYDALISQNNVLEAELNTAKEDNVNLINRSIEQQSIIDSFSEQISSISSTVGILDKLSKTDEELLKKYSKVYFLNENYVPEKLTDIDKSYVYNGTTNFLIHADVWPHLKRLLDDAKEEGIDLLIASAFRSFDTQAALKTGYNLIYGAGTANQFSADQGYSEHQLGTSVDFTTSKVGGYFTRFELDPSYQWLLDNAHKYGFILSYPKENTYYKYEPWHWRYVGIDLATDLHDDGKYFYNMDQREIDTYLIKLFE